MACSDRQLLLLLLLLLPPPPLRRLADPLDPLDDAEGGDVVVDADDGW